MPGYFTIIDKVQSDGFDTEDLKMDTLSKHGLKPIEGFKCIFTSLMIGFALGAVCAAIFIGECVKNEYENNSIQLQNSKRIDLWKDAVTRGHAEAIENEKGEVTYRWK